jgi:O-antigen/teichoic acid export membrane protein
MNLGQSIRHGVKWLLVGNMGGQILQFAYGVVLARLLVPADFGMILTIQVFTGFVGVIASGGMGQSLIRAKEADEGDFSAVFTLQLTLGVLIYIAFFISAPWVGSYFENPLYADLLRVSALSFMLRPFSAIRTSWLTRQMDFKKRTVIDLTVGAVVGVSSVLMAVAGMGVWSLTLSGLVGALTGNVLLSYATPLRVRFYFHTATMRRHSGFGFKITASEVLQHITEQSIRLILSKLAGPSFLGLFNKAESLARMPNRLVTPPTSQAVFRAMSKVQDNLDQTKYMFYRTITLLMLYSSPGLVGLWWLAEPLVGVVYGEKWLPVAKPLAIIVLSGFLRPIWVPCGLVLTAQNRLTQTLVVQAAALVFAIPAYLLGLTWGLEGVAWSLVACAVFNTALVYTLVSRTIATRLTELFAAITPVLLLDALLFAALAFAHLLLAHTRTDLPWFYLIVMALVGALGYTLAFLFLPIPALQTEAARWRRTINAGFSMMHRQTR